MCGVHARAASRLLTPRPYVRVHGLQQLAHLSSAFRRCSADESCSISSSLFPDCPLPARAGRLPAVTSCPASLPPATLGDRPRPALRPATPASRPTPVYKVQYRLICLLDRSSPRRTPPSRHATRCTSLRCLGAHTTAPASDRSLLPSPLPVSNDIYHLFTRKHPARRYRSPGSITTPTSRMHARLC